MENVTIKDVASLAGVSATTVSHVINSTRVVNDDTREKVERAIKQLNYQPNQLARSLRMKSTNTLGLIVSDINISHFTEAVRACEDYAYKHNYNTILCNTDENPKKELMYIKLLQQKQVDGIILSPTGKNEGTIKQLLSGNIPVVFIDRQIKDIVADYVGYDNYQASYDAVTYMIEMGYKNLSIIYSMGHLTPVKDRIEGFRQAVLDHHLPLGPISFLEISHNSTHEAFAQALDERLQGHPMPDGFFSAEQKLALHIMRFMRHKSILCPEDIGLVNFGDYSWFADFSPSISAVSLPTYGMGEAAASILISLIKKNHRKPKNVLLRTNFYARDSSLARDLIPEYKMLKNCSLPIDMEIKKK